MIVRSRWVVGSCLFPHGLSRKQEQGQARYSYVEMLETLPVIYEEAVKIIRTQHLDDSNLAEEVIKG